MGVGGKTEEDSWGQNNRLFILTFAALWQESSLNSMLYEMKKLDKIPFKYMNQISFFHETTMVKFGKYQNGVEMANAQG